MTEVFEKVFGLLRRRKNAYMRLFNRESVYTEEVLKDLARFCRANSSAFHPDPRVHAVLEGRREVWLRIQQQLNLSTEDLFKIYGRKDDQ